MKTQKCSLQKNVPFFSVLIPVFNAEETIDRCILSVINQDFPDFEIIAINDGSTDKSLFLLQKWGKLDNRIKVLSQANAGSNKAYNLGIQMAVGKFILSLDDDDEIGQGTLSLAFSSIKMYQPEIVQFGVDCYSHDGTLSYQAFAGENFCFDSRERILWAMKTNQFGWRTHSGKAIESSLAKSASFSGDPHGADTRYLMKILPGCKKLAINGEARWIYHFREKSQSNRPHNKDFFESWLKPMQTDLQYIKTTYGMRAGGYPEVDLYLDYYCRWCNAMLDDRSFQYWKARKYAFIMRKYLGLFKKEWHSTIKHRALAPLLVALRNHRASNTND